MIYPHLFDRPKDEAVRDFLLSKQWQDEATRRVRNSEQYAHYLKANNFYKPTRMQEFTAKWQAEWQALVASMEKRKEKR